jgi:hypothetical protein
MFLNDTHAPAPQHVMCQLQMANSDLSTSRQSHVQDTHVAAMADRIQCHPASKHLTTQAGM